MTLSCDVGRLWTPCPRTQSSIGGGGWTNHAAHIMINKIAFIPLILSLLSHSTNGRANWAAVAMAPSKSVVEESDASMRKRLVESLSQSFPGSALSKALHSMDPSDDPGDDPLSSSCFAEIRLEQGVIEEDDEELTSLSWLQDSNLIKSIGGDERLCASPTDDPDTKENGDIKTEGSYSNSHPPNVPYNPQKHINSKPPYSFSCLIFMAIEDSPMKKLPVKDIYNWILTHFPYFQNAPTGWKNSVRHNLSLNKCFKKVEKEKGQVGRSWFLFICLFCADLGSEG